MKLKEYIAIEGVKISHFAERLGVSRNAIYNLLKNTKKPSLELAVDIERVTNGRVKPRDWFDDDDAKEKEFREQLFKEQKLKDLNKD